MRRQLWRFFALVATMAVLSACGGGTAMSTLEIENLGITIDRPTSWTVDEGSDRMGFFENDRSAGVVIGTLTDVPLEESIVDVFGRIAESYRSRFALGENLLTEDQRYPGESALQAIGAEEVAVGEFEGTSGTQAVLVRLMIARSGGEAVQVFAYCPLSDAGRYRGTFKTIEESLRIGSGAAAPSEEITGTDFLYSGSYDSIDPGSGNYGTDDSGYVEPGSTDGKPPLDEGAVYDDTQTGGDTTGDDGSFPPEGGGKAAE